ncbi:MAG: ABC transporter permease [Caldilineaceae bacterium SB0670_bin_27]|uniref:ABC transporter permease n=1 Tax=Caldilineaceae bacterium SB0664_bin_27 TaxID=2605260 RepID=A0A6B0YME4_9CHLR|nr:ABC transporter permease [Caldilineaceae bacterium]MDE0339534.1 ABC transporter permease [Caldilineaceae bacterium]MXY92080.1 ABC transporter permease [Caldilineaceae bacterium SB0664_bin_27]MYJ76598.1 ABC transporter permease [Caldilineaceae bacterium SB0670_bin_27]
MAVGTETASAESLSSELPQRQHRTLWGDVWLRFRRHNLANIGVVVLVLLVIGVLAGPLIYTVDPEYSFIVDDIDSINQPPSVEYPLGTDDLGRDTLARNLFGGRISLAVGVVAMFVSITFGTLVGVLSGFFRRLDNPLMRFTDLMLALPSLPLLLVIIMLFRDSLKALLGPELGIFLLVVLVIGILGWMPTARVVRGSVLSIKEKEFVEAAVSVGTREPAILWQHILPNVLSPIIVSATLGVAAAILTESALSFLGLGFPSNVPTWGRLLFENKDFITQNPWLVIWPGLFISLTILSINFIGDGLRDALDPRQRR